MDREKRTEKLNKENYENFEKEPTFEDSKRTE